MGFLALLRDRDRATFDALCPVAKNYLPDPAIVRRYLVALDVFDGDDTTFFHQLVMLNKENIALLHEDSAVSTGKILQLLAASTYPKDKVMEYLAKPHESEEIISELVGAPRADDPTALMPPEDLLRFCSKPKERLGVIARAIRAKDREEKKRIADAEKLRVKDEKAKLKLEAAAQKAATQATKTRGKKGQLLSMSNDSTTSSPLFPTVNIADLMNDMSSTGAVDLGLPAAESPPEGLSEIKSEVGVQEQPALPPDVLLVKEGLVISPPSEPPLVLVSEELVPSAAATPPAAELPSAAPAVAKKKRQWTRRTPASSTNVLLDPPNPAVVLETPKDQMLPGLEETPSPPSQEDMTKKATSHDEPISWPGSEDRSEGVSGAAPLKARPKRAASPRKVPFLNTLGSYFDSHSGLDFEYVLQVLALAERENNSISRAIHSVADATSTFLKHYGAPPELASEDMSDGEAD